MQVTRHMVLLACLLTVSISFCKQENVEEYTEEGVDEEIVGDEKPPTAAEQYLDFISGGGNLEEDVGEGNSGFEGPPPPEGYEEVVGNDGEDDYGVESLNLLLKHYRKQFEGLSSDKIKSKLADEIKQMDTDGDGQITKPELTAWFIRQAEIGSSLEAEKLGGMRSYDVDKDGKLSWDEIFEDLKKLGSMGNPTFKRGIEMEKVRFELADKDKDNLLNYSEYGFYATPEYFSHMDNYTIMSYIHDYDHNDDSKVSKEEYLKGFDQVNDKEGYKIEADKFDELDKNKDGFLSSDEVYNVAMEFTLTKFVDKHADILFLHIDADKNGRLSNMEIVTNYPMFTKGATDNVTETEYQHDEL